MVKDEPIFVPLTAELRDQFEQDGFLVIPDALDTETRLRLIEAGDRLMASERKEDRETMKDGWDSFRNVVALDEAFLCLLTPQKTFAIIVQLLGYNIHLLSSQLIYLAPYRPGMPRSTRTPDAPGWHRDIYGVANDLGHAAIPRLAIKCAYYLTDVSSEESGMTLFAPGSHKLKTNIPIPPGQINPENAVRPQVKAGDAVLFENRTFHAGGINTSGMTRKCVMIQYGFRWLNPVDYVQQRESLLETCGPVQRQLLGIQNRDAEGRIFMGLGAQGLKEWCMKHQVIYQPTS